MESGPGEFAGRKILVIRAPQVLSYFNAGHHLALYQVAGYLRRISPQSIVKAIDASVLTLTWKDIADELFNEQYDFIVIMNDLDGLDGLDRFLRYASSLSPASKTITFGRLSGLTPSLFEQYALDAIVESGDYEPSVHQAMIALANGALDAPGSRIRQNRRWHRPSEPGLLIEPTEWILPDPGEIPYSQYDDLYGSDHRKFSGLPNKRELVVPTARGCPIGCDFCEVPAVFGLKERHLPVASTLDYIRKCFKSHPFDYVSFYAPTFTLNKQWVYALCAGLRGEETSISWKCCTTMHHLDEHLVGVMGKSGCLRISVGLETLDENAYPGLPRVKRKQEHQLRELAQVCASSGIELNCFVVIGLPGTTLESARQTIETARSLGARVRPTIYTPYTKHFPETHGPSAHDMNRQIFAPGSTELDLNQQLEAYSLVYGR
jgi:radical SAM superfamily enzyme YgiQ (UPF0313 family)